MSNALQLSDPLVFVSGTDANELALEALAELFKGAGFNVRKKSHNEYTLRVYPIKQNEYPLLNPRFVDGQLETTVLSKHSDAALSSALAAIDGIPGFTFKSYERFEQGYWYHGVIVSTLDNSVGLSALSSPLRALHDLLVQHQLNAPRTEAEKGTATSPRDGFESEDSAPSTRNAADDITEILRGKGTPTEKEARIRARLGQGEFRRDVLVQWGGRCAVTGVGVPEVIRASHIKPWRESDDYERLDPSNGLPLIATLDALFDTGLISFTDTGKVLVSPRLPDSLVARLQPLGDHLRVEPDARMRGYLEFHRTKVFKRK